MNKRQILSLFVLATAALCGPAAAQDANSDVVFKPISLSSQFDFGQIVEGKLYSGEKIHAGSKLEGNFFQRTGVWITQEAVVKDRLDLKMGVGGLFWYALPNDPSNAPTVLTQFGPGISQAQATYTFGDLSNPMVSLQMGYFPYKYNSDAKNLGEYLLRSGTYPGYVVSGGWNMIASAAYMVEGLRLNLNLLDSKLQVDFLLPMEHDVPPMFDLSPTVVATYKPIAGIEVGAGVDCNHCLPIKPSAEHPHDPANSVVTGLTIDSSGAVFDSNGTYVSGYYSYNYTKDPNKYYTFQGVKLMGRASIDPKAFFPMPMLGSEDLKVYGEFAVLGVKDYPYLYNDIFQRIPVMWGINLPTFRLLDVLSFEMEYYGSKNPNSLLQPINASLPVADYLGSDHTPDQNEVNNFNSEVKRDNWKWSVFAQRDIVKGMQIYAQVASDHIRTIEYNAGALPTYAPITNRNGKDWYYLVRFQFGI